MNLIVVEMGIKKERDLHKDWYENQFPTLYGLYLNNIDEAIELVDQWGGLEDAKLYDLSHCKSKPESMGYKLMQAINLVEKCQ